MKQSQFGFTRPVIEEINYKIKELDTQELSNDNPIALRTSVDVQMAKDKEVAVVKIILCIEETDSFPYDINITMSTQVQWDKDISDELRDNVLHKNVPATLVSYIRPILSLITSYSNYNSFDLPFLDFRNTAENNNSNTPD